MEVTLPPEQEALLRRLAEQTGRDPNDLAQEAIGQLLEHEQRFIEAVEKGLASLDRGDYVSHEDAWRRVEKRIAERFSPAH